MTPAELAARITAAAAGGPRRYIVAIAGPPGAGKSTLATDLAERIGEGARVVPMDGFHLDDAVLNARGLRHRKGAPETFDAAGFLHLLQRLRAEEEVAIPIFDRTLELSRAAADVVTALTERRHPDLKRREAVEQRRAEGLPSDELLEISIGSGNEARLDLLRCTRA